MDASSNRPPPPKKTQKSIEKQRYIPLEIIEEILLSLPVKSVLRFSSVSKPWNSIVSQRAFVNRYALHLHSRERVFTGSLLFRRLSDLLSDDNPIKDATDLDGPFLGMQIRAFCNELAFVEKGHLSFLSNPSMRTHRKIPPSPSQSSFRNFSAYGLGYDSVGDDYKLVKVKMIYSCNNYQYIVSYTGVEMYSLRSDSWREIHPFPEVEEYVSYKSSFVSGALHWLVSRGGDHAVISFDLSTEKYGEVMLPSRFVSTKHHVRLDVAMGKLCVCLTDVTRLGLWMMEKYGDVESWTNKFEVDCVKDDIIPRFSGNFLFWELVYFCDSEEERVVIIRTDFNPRTNGIYVYEFDECKSGLLLKKNCLSAKFSEGRVFVESLISPAMWPTC